MTQWPPSFQVYRLHPSDFLTTPTTTPSTLGHLPTTTTWGPQKLAYSRHSKPPSDKAPHNSIPARLSIHSPPVLCRPPVWPQLLSSPTLSLSHFLPSVTFHQMETAFTSSQGYILPGPTENSHSWGLALSAVYLSAPQTPQHQGPRFS